MKRRDFLKQTAAAGAAAWASGMAPGVLHADHKAGTPKIRSSAKANIVTNAFMTR